MRWIWPTEKSQYIMGYVQIVMDFFFPLLVVTYCYGSIICMLSRRINNKQLSSGSEVKNPSADKFQQAKRNTLITLAIVAICFVLCWSQVELLYLMYNVGYSVDFHGFYFNFSLLVAFGNCTVNPFVYLLKYKDYQVALREFFNFCFGRKNNEQVEFSFTASDKQQVSVDHVNQNI